jgi:hypothetical protein
MAAMKPRTGDGPMEVTKEGRGIVMRVPVDGGGRLVVELNAQEATDLLEALTWGCRLRPHDDLTPAPARGNPAGAVACQRALYAAMAFS